MLDGDLLAYSSMAISPFTGLFLVAIHTCAAWRALAVPQERVPPARLLTRSRVGRAVAPDPMLGTGTAMSDQGSLQKARFDVSALGGGAFRDLMLRQPPGFVVLSSCG